ncbi:MAG: alpha/beta hydrolase [Silvanigrellaceae bacterium]|nr:alpha/beta hydrolase [Silvanigrellaceae bacterium]
MHKLTWLPCERVNMKKIAAFLAVCLNFTLVNLAAVELPGDSVEGAHGRRLRVNDINLYYEIHGEGKPLLFINGLGADTQGWLNMVGPFTSAGFKMILLDNRGSGQSDSPDVSYTTKLMADDAAELLRQLRIEKASVIGCSMGGMIAQELSIYYPELVDKLVGNVQLTVSAVNYRSLV